MKTNRPLLKMGIIVAIGTLFLFAQGISFALAAYPSRTIELIIKGGPGSGLARLARVMTKLAPKYLGQSMVVVYKRGGAGAVAQSYIQKRPADGHRVFLETCTMCIVIALGKVPFKASDWHGVIRMQVDPQGAAVHADSPWKNYKDVAAWAHKNPGKLRWAGAHAIGMDPFTVRMLINSAKGIKIKYLPSDGAHAMVAQLLGRKIDIAILNPSEAKEQVAAGKLRMVGVAHPRRLKVFPNWPTFKEQGHNVVVGNWRGIFVKRGTPAAVVKKLHDALNKLRRDPELVNFNAKTAQLDGYIGGPKVFDAFFAEQVELMGKIFKKK